MTLNNLIQQSHLVLLVFSAIPNSYLKVSYFSAQYKLRIYQQCPVTFCRKCSILLLPLHTHQHKRPGSTFFEAYTYLRLCQLYSLGFTNIQAHQFLQCKSWSSAYLTRAAACICSQYDNLLLCQQIFSAVNLVKMNLLVAISVMCWFVLRITK